MPSKTLEQNNENQNFYDAVLFDLPTEELSHLPYEGLFTFSGDEFTLETQWNNNNPPHQMANSSSSATITYTETNEDATKQHDQKQAYAVENMPIVESGCRAFEKFINDEFANNQQLYRDHQIVPRKRSANEGYTGVSVRRYKSTYAYSVYLHENLKKTCFALFNEAIIAAIGHDFIVKARNLSSPLNFSEALYTEEKIRACRNILIPIIQEYQTYNQIDEIRSISSLNQAKDEKSKKDFLEFLNAFKEKHHLYFSAEGPSGARLYAESYSGVHVARKIFSLAMFINLKKISFGNFKDKITAAIGYDFIVKVLGIKRKVNFKASEFLYTEEEVIACKKIILPFIDGKTNLDGKNKNQAEEAIAASYSAAAAAAPKSTIDLQPHIQHPYDYLESTWYQNSPLTYAYDGHSYHAGSAGSTYNLSETSTGNAQASRRNKKARIE